MNIKKLTPLEASQMRDNLALTLVSDTATNGGTLSIAKAFKIAEEFVEGRRLGKVEIDMDCGCNEEKPFKNGLSKSTTTPRPSTAPKEEELRTFKAKAKGRPPIWFILIVAFLIIAGLITVAVKFVEFIKWLF